MTLAYAFDDIGNKSAVNALKKIAYEKPENIPEPKISGITPWHKIPPAQNTAPVTEMKYEIKGQDKGILPTVYKSEIRKNTAPDVAPLWLDNDSAGWAFLKGILNGNN